jgi:hypothetical protein
MDPMAQPPLRTRGVLDQVRCDEASGDLRSAERASGRCRRPGSKPVF